MMNRTNRRKDLHLSALLTLPLMALPFAISDSAFAQKDAKSIVAAACANEVQSDRSAHTAFMYRDHDITPDHDTLFAIIETPDGNLKRKLEDHGHPLTDQQRKDDDARIHTLLNDPVLQKKLRKDSAHDDEQAEELLKLLPTAFLWTLASENGDLITLDFKPDPSFDPPNMEARVFADMRGQIVVSKSENRIRSMRGEMVDDVKILGGVVGRLHKGGTFQVEHREVAPHHWQLTELHVHIVGHILFNFKTIGSQEDEIKTDYKVSPAQTLQQAWEMLNPPAPTAAMVSSAKPKKKITPSSMPSAEPPAIRRFDTVDVLRGISILLVILLHTFIRMAGIGFTLKPVLPPWLFHLLLRNGDNCVTIFFAISGFLIAFTSIKRFGGLGDLKPTTFYRIRFARIAPLLLLLLAVLSVLHLIHAEGFTINPRRETLPGALFAALTFHLNWHEAVHGYLPANWDILWSLSVEEMFYLFFPLACVFLLRRSRVYGPSPRYSQPSSSWVHSRVRSGQPPTASGRTTPTLAAWTRSRSVF